MDTVRKINLFDSI